MAGILQGVLASISSPYLPPLPPIISTAWGDPATINRASGPTISNVNSVATVSTTPAGSERSFSASFNGTSNYLQASLNSGQTIQGTGNFTIRFWARLNSGSTLQYQRIFALAQSNGSDEISIEYYGGNRVTVNNGNGSQMTNIPVGDVNDWFNITLLRTSGELRIYVGRNLESSVSVTTNFSALDTLRIGARIVSGDFRGWPGLVHDFSFVNNQALIPT